MSGISSSIGLISGIDTAALIDQLMAIESQPITNLEKRVEQIDVKRAAFLKLSAQLLAVQNAASQFNKLSFFRRFQATSSNEGVLTANAGEGATPGSISFRVHSLVSNHAVLSRGFADMDSTPVGLGTLSIEVGRGRVDDSTELAMLNAGRGVRRGTIAITDRSGATADIDLSTAVTVDDVLNAINANTTINVRARVTGVSDGNREGDRIVIEDLTADAQRTGNLIIADKNGGSTAADLGILADTPDGRIDGADLMRLASATPLSILNDGNGVGNLFNGPDLVFTRNGDPAQSFNVSLSDVLTLDTRLTQINHGQGVRTGERVIRITDRAGNSAEVDLTDAVTIRDVRDAINAADVDVSITAVNSRLQIIDTSGAPDAEAANLTVEDVIGTAAADLGIAASVEANDIQGRDIYSVSTVGDVIRAINSAVGNDGLVRADISADGNAITLTALGEFDTFEVTAGADSTAASDLGLQGATFGNGERYTSRHLLAGLNTVLLQSLRGGAGATPGEVSFTGSDGQAATVDFSAAHTLRDVIDLINDNTAFTASVSETGTGVVLRDGAGGAGQITIADVGGGTLAADLGIAGTFDPGEVINSGNLQRQYVSRQTLLSDLDPSRTPELGTFQISDATGAVHTVVLAPNLKTVGQVIDTINASTPDTLEARINDTGDGLVIIDSSVGELPLTITDRNGGSTAAFFRLAGTAEEGENFIDGSYEVRIEVGASDTLADVVRMLNESGGAFTASVLNDGSSLNPFSLSITAAQSGRSGRLAIDTSGLDLGFRTLTKARDAVVSIGDGEAGDSLLVTSSTNTLDDVLEGVTINLVGVSDEAVTINVNQDHEAVVESISAFVEKYNELFDGFDEATKFDPETLERGPLLGDSTVNLIRTRLQRLTSRPFGSESSAVSRLFAIGVSPSRSADNPGRLTFDEQRFRETYERSPDLVEQFFTMDGTGFGHVIHESLDDITRSFDGVLARKSDLLTDQQEVLNDRISQLEVLLAAKRRRLESQFTNLETALAGLQEQQTALNNLAQLASGVSVGG